MTVFEFVNKWLGKKCDFDGAYGAQCVDLFRMYCKEVLRAGHQLPAVDGAKDLYLNYKGDILPVDYFRKIKTKKPQYGDVVVFGATPSNKYGHVAICLGLEGDKILCFEQNGFTQKGGELCRRSTDNLLGSLRFKGALE